MKITLSRDEIQKIVKEHFGLTFDDFLLEISSENSKKLKTSNVEAEPVAEKEPEVEYDITVDSNGFITDMVPKQKSSSAVPFTDSRGRTYNYENTCKVCGKTFFTMNQPADVCSGGCLEQHKKDIKKATPRSHKPYDKHVYDHHCKICGKYFTSDGPRSKYCSEECRKAGTTEYKPENTKHTNAAKKHSSMLRKPQGKFKCDVPKEPKLDYTAYALKIEEFLNSSNQYVILDPEGISPAGIRDRYRVAANMFDLADKVHISYSAKRRETKLSRRLEEV